MNILIGKIGKAVKFKNVDIMFGDDAPAIFYSTMSRMLPEHNFYFGGPNNLNDLTEEERNHLFPNKNVFSCYKKGYQIDGDKHLVNFDSIIDYLKEQNIKLDFALLFNGFCGKINTCNKVINKKTGEYYQSLQAFRYYAAPYIHVVNVTGCPLYMISEDARYVTVNARDLYNRERLILTQCKDQKITPKYEHIKSYDDQDSVIETIQCVYAGVEKIFMMGMTKDWKEKIDVNRKLNNTQNPKCIVLSNGHGADRLNNSGVKHDARLPEYKKYAIDALKGTQFSNTKIYGIWSDEIYDQFPNIQKKGIIELGDEIADAKYTIVYSIIPGFVTVKAYEMITLGLIPFIHPDYDKDRLLGLPEYLYVTSPEDFRDKMEYLENSPDEYKKLLNECIECIKPSYLDGSYLINNVMRLISKDLGIEYKDHEGVEPVLNHFEKNVLNMNNKVEAEKETYELF